MGMNRTKENRILSLYPQTTGIGLISNSNSAIREEEEGEKLP
jgi:hypothetical protein